MPGPSLVLDDIQHTTHTYTHIHTHTPTTIHTHTHKHTHIHTHTHTHTHTRTNTHIHTHIHTHAQTHTHTHTYPYTHTHTHIHTHIHTHTPTPIHTQEPLCNRASLHDAECGSMTYSPFPLMYTPPPPPPSAAYSTSIHVHTLTDEPLTTGISCVTGCIAGVRNSSSVALSEAITVLSTTRVLTSYSDFRTRWHSY